MVSNVLNGYKICSLPHHVMALRSYIQPPNYQINQALIVHEKALLHYKLTLTQKGTVTLQTSADTSQTALFQTNAHVKF